VPRSSRVRRALLIAALAVVAIVVIANGGGPSLGTVPPSAAPSAAVVPSVPPVATASPSPLATSSGGSLAPSSAPPDLRPASAAINLRNCRDVVIEDRTFRDLGTDVIAIHLDRCENVIIRNVDFIDVAEGVYAERSRNITVVDSRYENIIGPSTRRRGINTGNFVQFDRVDGGLIARNSGRGGDTEDIVSLFRTSNVVVEENHFEGTDWKSASGSGIALGDDGGTGNTARGNILVNPGQVGIFIAGGKNHRIVDNIIYGEQRPRSNVGMYVWNQYDHPCSGHTVSGNRVSWTTEDGNANPFWNAGDCGEITGKNTFEAFDPDPFRVPPLDPTLP
jgi:hypothetical protein